MLSRVYLPLVFAAVLFLVSCGEPRFTVKEGIETPEDAYAIAMYDASRRGTILGRNMVLAEPPPDVAYNETISLLSEISAQISDSAEGGAKVDYNRVAEALAMTNRTTSIMILRDALFRLSEAQFNAGHQADLPLGFRQEFRAVVSAAAAIAETELTRARQELAETEQAPERIAAIRESIASIDDQIATLAAPEFAPTREESLRDLQAQRRELIESMARIAAQE